MSNQFKYPWARPDYWGDEKKYLLDAFDSTWISGGTYVERLEDGFNRIMNSKSLAVSNATNAIHLAYIGIGLKPGDEVIVPGFGFLAAANVAVNLGIIPIFSDVSPQTWCMTAENIEKCITNKSKAIVVVHNYGNICDMESICKLADKYNLIVIEDAAEALFSKYRGQYAGTLGEIGIFSFQATKTITSGEGGLLITKNHALHQKMALYRSHGLLRKKHYWHEVPGLNFRLTNIQAAIAYAQFEKRAEIILERKRVDLCYRERLKKFEGVRMQVITDNADPLIWATAVYLNSNYYKQGRDVVIEQMASYGIETRPGFYCPDEFAFLKAVQSIEECKKISHNTISLPSYPTLTNEEIQEICDQLVVFSSV